MADLWTWGFVWRRFDFNTPRVHFALTKTVHTVNAQGALNINRRNLHDGSQLEEFATFFSFQ